MPSLPMKQALQQLTAACIDGGKVRLEISRAERIGLEPHIALMRTRLGAVISITGSDGDFTADVRVLARDNAPKPRGRTASPERQAIEALEPGASVTLQLGVMSLEGVDQKIHAVQRILGVKLTRQYERTSNTVTITRIDNVPGGYAPDELRFKSRGRTPKYNLRTMSPGDVLFVDDGTDLRAMRSTCAYHTKAQSKVEFKAVESSYDNAIEVHCLPRTTSGAALDAARKAIKKQKIARVLIGEGITKQDGSAFGSASGSTSTGYDGVTFFTSMIDDVLEVVSPGETVRFAGIPKPKLAERANYWAGVRDLKAVIAADTVRFE